MNYNFSGINNTREMREILQVLKTYNRIHASQGYSGNVDTEDFRQAYNAEFGTNHSAARLESLLGKAKLGSGRIPRYDESDEILEQYVGLRRTEKAESTKELRTAEKKNEKLNKLKSQRMGTKALKWGVVLGMALLFPLMISALVTGIIGAFVGTVTAGLATTVSVGLAIGGGFLGNRLFGGLFQGRINRLERKIEAMDEDSVVDTLEDAQDKSDQREDEYQEALELKRSHIAEAFESYENTAPEEEIEEEREEEIEEGREEETEEEVVIDPKQTTKDIIKIFVENNIGISTDDKKFGKSFKDIEKAIIEINSKIDNTATKDDLESAQKEAIDEIQAIIDNKQKELKATLNEKKRELKAHLSKIFLEQKEIKGRFDEILNKNQKAGNTNIVNNQIAINNINHFLNVYVGNRGYIFKDKKRVRLYITTPEALRHYQLKSNSDKISLLDVAEITGVMIFKKGKEGVEEILDDRVIKLKYKDGKEVDIEPTR